MKTTSLELSQRLKVLGVPQKSLFWHEINNIDRGIPTGEIIYSKDMVTPIYYAYEYVSSYSSDELGEWLLDELGDEHEDLPYFLTLTKLSDYWVVDYRGDRGVLADISFEADTLAEAMGLMLEYLIINGYINVETLGNVSKVEELK